MASLVVLLAPAVGCFLLFLMKERDDADRERIRGTATAFVTVSLLAAFWMWMNYDTSGERYQYVIDASWAPSLGIGFRLGVDGISIAIPSPSSPACRGSSRLGTRGTGPGNASLRQLAKGPRQSAWCTSTCKACDSAPRSHRIRGRASWLTPKS